MQPITFLIICNFDGICLGSLPETFLSDFVFYTKKMLRSSPYTDTQINRTVAGLVFHIPSLPNALEVDVHTQTRHVLILNTYWTMSSPMSKISMLPNPIVFDIGRDCVQISVLVFTNQSNGLI